MILRTIGLTISAGVCAVSLLTAPTPARAHGLYAWINEGAYKAADGTHCCGWADCVEVKPGELTEAPGGLRTPYGLVHSRGVYQSRDGKAWVCRRQRGAGPRSSCAFVPGGG